MNSLDIGVFALYILIVICVALYVSRGKKGKEQTTRDYFLAGNTLPWWAIGTSLIAANISAEQLIGMTGDGYRIGLAIASYEWMAAATLIVVAKYFLPIFLEKRIYSMPQFLDIRYDGKVRTTLSILWLVLYIFVNLTSIMYLGGKCIETVFGIDLQTAIIAIALFSAVYTIAGGLMAIAYTDFIQVTFLIAGGLITTYLALNKFSDGGGIMVGMSKLVDTFPQKFDMILSPDSPNYVSLPGLTVLVGGMWIVNLNYWGCNQYITQRALAAKNLGEAQKGLIFAGFLKLIMPIIVVVPGIIAFGLEPDKFSAARDGVYPWLLNTFLFPGVKGVAFAALVAAVVGSLSSKTNSIATIFTMDIYKPFFGDNKSEKHLVLIGRITTAVSLLIAVVVAKPLISGFGGGFEFIQQFTGFFSPGIFVIFIAGLFWKQANAKGALLVAILTLPLSLAFYFTPGLKDIPFLDKMGIIFLMLLAVMVVTSLATKSKLGVNTIGYDGVARDVSADPKSIVFTPNLFKTGWVFNTGALVIIGTLVFLYVTFW